MQIFQEQCVCVCVCVCVRERERERENWMIMSVQIKCMLYHDYYVALDQIDYIFYNYKFYQERKIQDTLTPQPQISASPRICPNKEKTKDHISKTMEQMKEQVIYRLPTAFSHTKPVNYQNVPPAKLLNCQDFLKGCSPCKEHHILWDLGQAYALPGKRNAWLS